MEAGSPWQSVACRQITQCLLQSSCGLVWCVRGFPPPMDSGPTLTLTFVTSSKALASHELTQVWADVCWGAPFCLLHESAERTVPHLKDELSQWVQPAPQGPGREIGQRMTAGAGQAQLGQGPAESLGRLPMQPRCSCLTSEASPALSSSACHLPCDLGPGPPQNGLAC